MIKSMIAVVVVYFYLFYLSLFFGLLLLA